MLELEGGIIGTLPPYVLLGGVLEFALLDYIVLELEEEATFPPYVLFGVVLEFVLFGDCALELDVVFDGAFEFVLLGDCVPESEGGIIGTFSPYVLFDDGVLEVLLFGD